MLFYVLPPHAHDCVPVVTVQLSILPSKRKTFPCVFAKKFREKFTFNGVYGIEAEPSSEGWKCDMGRRLYNGTGNGEALRLEAHIGGLYEIGCMSQKIRRYMVRVTLLIWKRLTASLGTTL